MVDRQTADRQAMMEVHKKKVDKQARRQTDRQTGSLPFYWVKDK